MQMGHKRSYFITQDKNSVDGCIMYLQIKVQRAFLREKVLTIVLTLNFINDPFPQMKDEQTDNL